MPRRRRSRPRPSTFAPFAAPLRLGLERLEDRLLLSTIPAADYDRVTPAWFAALPAASPAPAESDPWIVRLTPAAVSQAGDVAGAARLLAHLPVKVVRGLGLPGQLLVAGRGAASAAVGEALADSPLVSSYQRDAPLGGAILPNDPDLNNGVHATALSQYALYNTGQAGGTADADIDADLAWDITTGSASVVTAVIDTGIFYTHPDLAANAWTNPGEIAGDGLDNDANGFIDDVHGWDFVNGDNAPLDDHGHGTHVAGAIGAVGNNGLGVTGVNWTTRLMALKFLDRNNVGSVVNAVAAINYATMMRSMHGVNVRVINASWGGAGVDDPALRAAIAAAGAADILFVAAAGNGDVFGRGQNIDELPFYPASFNLDNILVVGASDRNDNLATFSNYGPNTVDIVAPGLSVWNANLFVDGPLNAPTYAASYGVRSGTSMAAPLVAGTAALAWASAPLATAGEIRDAILAGGDGYHPVDRPNLLALQGKIASGKRLNARGALVSLPPQARVISALDVTSTNLGQTTYQFTVELTSNAGITAGSVGSGDLLVRRKGTTGADLTAMLVSAPPISTVTQWTGTYQITPPGGSWDVLDGGIYEIVVVSGQLADVNGLVSRQKPVDEFAVNMEGAYVYRPTVFTDGGSGSLREAIALANAVTPGQNPNGGTVLLAAGTYVLNILGADEDSGATGDLDISGKVTVASDGSGPVEIVTGDWDRVFDVRPAATFNLNGVTLRQGNVTPAVAPVVTAGADVTIQTGVTYTTKGVVADADSSTFTATVNYGEGAGAQPLAINADKTFTLSNEYEAVGSYEVTVTVTDHVGQTGSHQFLVTVDDPLPLGSAAFTPLTTVNSGANSSDLLAADFTGDGILELLSSNKGSHTLSLFRGNGDGTLQSPTTVTGVNNAHASVAADFNHDGRLDLAVGEYASPGGLRVLLGNGDGTFAAPVFYGMGGAYQQEIQVGDFDADGHPDLITVNYGPGYPQAGSITFLWGVGNGTFADSSSITLQSAITDVQIGNIDADLQLEVLAISGATYSVNRLDQVSGRQFQLSDSITIIPGAPDLVTEAFVSSVLTDFNGDGKLDFAIANSRHQNFHVSLGNGDGTFQPATSFPFTGAPNPQYVAAGDVNGDGLPDLMVTTFYAGVRVFINQGAGVFASIGDIPIGNEARDTVLQDLDGNGSLDLAVAREDGSGLIYVYRNVGPAASPRLALAVPDAARPGQAFPVVVTVRDAAGNVRTDFTGTVRFKSSLAGAQLPADYTFTPGDAGSHTFLLTRATAGDETLSVHLASDLSRFDLAELDVVALAAQGADDGGGLRNAGTATLDRVVIKDFATADRGGGVFNAGTLTIQDSTIADCSAAYQGGGGLFNAATGVVQISNSTINDNAAAPTLAGPLAIYRADGNGENSAGGPIASLQGSTTYGPGYSGQAFQFNASADSRVVVPGYSGLNLQTFTVEAWVNADTPGSFNDSQGAVLVSKDRPSANPSFVILGPGNTNRFSFQVAFTDGTAPFFQSSNSYAFDVWHHVALTWDGSWMRGYVNGNLEGELWVDGSKQIAFDPNVPVTFGAHAAPGGRYLDGRLDEIGIYNRALGANELQNLVNAGDGGGVYNAGTLTATNVTISGNEAANQGGGVFNATGATATIASATITENSAVGLAATTALTTVGGEFRVNTTTAGQQSNGKVSFDPSGRAVSTWSDASQSLSMAQFYNANGTPASGERQLNAGVDHGADIATMDDGRSLAFWTNNDGSGLGAAGSILLPNGDATVSVNPDTYVSGNQYTQAVATDGQDRYVVVWMDDARDGSGRGVFARLYDQNGTTVGAEFQVNTTTDSHQQYADASMWDDGTFVVAFGSFEGTNNVRARLFSANGTPIPGPNGTNDFLLSLGTSGDQFPPRVAVHDAGFVAVWLADGAVVARRFDRTGNPLGGEIPVTDGAVNGYAWSRLAMLPDGGFVVVWDINYGAGDPQECFAQRFSADGMRIGGAFRINTTTAGHQYNPAVATTEGGKVLVTWAGGGPGDSPDGIFAQRYQFTYYDAGGISNVAGGAVNLKNSIVAANTSAHNAADVAGVFASWGGNLIGDDSSSSGFSQASDKVGSILSRLDAKLGPLADNGGPTKTHLPAADSPALDAGVAAGAPATDQRGVARPKDGDNNGVATIDIGAVERYYASISGRKFKDQNQNGVQDGGEPGIVGWTMYLDVNSNGRLDAGEPSAVTDAQGNYKFSQLDPGAYAVAEISPPGWVRTYTGTLYLEEIVDASSGALGLEGASSMAATADGKFVYVAGAAEAKIQRFSRNATTGQLTALGTATSTDQVGGVNVLQSVVKLVVAPVATTSGLFLYALSAEGALTIFSVNVSTGALTQVDVVQNGQNRGTTVARMVGATGLAVSPDGNRVYVSNFSANALNGGSLLIFERVVGQSPELRLRRILSNGAVGASPYGAGGRGVAIYGNNVYIVGETADASDTLATYTLAAAPAYLSYVSVHRNGQGGVTGLDGANDAAISADGKFLYVSAATSGAVTVFARDTTTGALTFLESLAEGAADGTGNIVAGVQDASSVALSDDGSRVYVTGRKYFADLDLSVGAVAVFQRNATTGRLTFLHALADSVPDALGAPIENLEYAADAFAFGDFAYVISGADENALTTFRRDGEGRDRRTLLVGQDLTGVNFSSYAPPAEIRGTTYNDLDNDGARDLDENVLGGVAVYLDLNDNDSYDPGEPTFTTAAQGQFVFDDLTAPATYAVRVIAATNQNVTFPAAADNREWSVQLAPNEVRAGVDFLIHGALAGQGPGEISGRVWQDLNGDGVRQESEPYLVGRSVYLDANDNGVYNPGIDLLTTTGAEGLYAFTTLGRSTFVVRVLTGAGESTSAFVGNAFVDQKLPTGAQPLGLVSADFNGDGKLDLATIDQNADQVSVLLQQAGGGFAGRTEHRVGSQPTGIAVGRFNNDALLDIAVVHWSLSRVVFLLNQPGSPGTFVRAATPTEIIVPSGYTSIAAADIDLDGDDDLAVAVDGGAGSDVVQIWPNNNGAAPTFALLSQHALGNAAPLSIAAGDLTSDGRAEFVLGNFVGDSVQALRNNAGTSFTLLDPVSVPDGPASVFIAPDMNGDGHKDVVTANIGGNGKAAILAGDGLGGLTKVAEVDTGAGPRTVAVADVDNDGDLDLLIGKVSQAQTNNVNDVVVLRRQGPGLVFSFPESTGQASFASLGEAGVKQVLVAMLDGDAVPDIAAVRGDASTGSLTVLYNAIASGARRVDLVAAEKATNQDFGITTAGPAHPGDYDGDQDRDGHDFLVWQRALGSPAVPPGSGADGDASGAVGGGDLTVWRNAFGQTPAAAAASLAAVPTPATEVAPDAPPEHRDAVSARAAFYAAGDFTQLFAEVRFRRPARRARFALVGA